MVAFVETIDFKTKMWILWLHHIGKKQTPDKGLEPLTVGLKVQRSTDWANRASDSLFDKCINNYACTTNRVMTEVAYNWFRCISQNGMGKRWNFCKNFFSFQYHGRRFVGIQTICKSTMRLISLHRQSATARRYANERLTTLRLVKSKLTLI